MSTRAQLIADMNAKIISGSRSTTAANLRAFETGMINSNVNKTDDLDVVNGYLGISSLGIVNIGFIKKTSPTGEFLKDDGTWSSVLTSVPTLSQVLTAGNTSGANNILFSSGQGIDNGSFGVILNIGATNSGVINYGNASTIHNFLGTAIYELQVNSYVTDKLITLNYGGSLASGIGVGFEIEENSVITGYWKTNSSRDGWVTKLPAITNTGTFDFSTVTGARIWSMPNATGTLALTSAISGTTNYLSKFTSANAVGNSLVYDDGTNVGIGLTSMGARFHVVSTGTTNATAGFAVQNSGGVSAVEVWDDGRVSFNRTGYGFGSDAVLNSRVDNSTNFNTNWEIYNTRTTGSPRGVLIYMDGASGSNTALQLQALNGTVNTALYIAAGSTVIDAGAGNNVAIGSTTVVATSKVYIKGANSASTDYVIQLDSASASVMYVRNDGFVSIGTSARVGAELLRVNGVVYLDSVLAFGGSAIGDATDTTKAIAFSLSGATTAKTLTITTAHTNNRTLTIPDATTTMVGTDVSQTLTNKILTAPDINGGTADSLISLSIRDTSAAFDVVLTCTSSAALTATRTITIDVNNSSPTVQLGAWVDWSGSINPQGFSATSVVKSRYVKIGKMVTMFFQIIGTSNATTFTFTLPFAAANNTSENQSCFVATQNLGVSAASNGYTTPNSTTFTINNGVFGGGFTASGTKTGYGIISYETT